MRAILGRFHLTFHWCATAVISFAFSLHLASATPSTPPVRKNVLVITEVGITHRAAASITGSLASGLLANQEYQVEYYEENLDTPAFADEASQQRVEKLIVEEYQGRKMAVIVVVGPRPIKFVSRFASTFFPGVPVVFGGSTEEQAGNPRLDPRFTGSWMKLEPGKTLDAALQLIPQTQHVVVVSGSSAFDKGIEAQMRAGLSSRSWKVDITYLTDLTMPNLLERLRHLPARTIVLYASFFRDAAGNEFVNATTALPMVSEAAKAPVFGISDTYLGHGVVGGCVLNFTEQGQTASRLVLEILRGKNPRDIPIQLSPSTYMFDWKQLQRWGLLERNLPPDSAVLFQEPSLWQRAKWILVNSVLVLLALSSLTAYLLFNRRQLRRARDEQIRLSGMLINAQEEERKRIAAELHDDFSQRLALLSLGLETAAELVPDSPKEANEQLHELVNAASELGSDIHTLSHHLHSSTLDRLGLVPGIRALCKEFSAQQGLEVVFNNNGVIDGVAPNVGLCLFRIVQEALRNVKRHSGASKAQVAMEQRHGNLHLSVSDNGAGFDVKDAARRQGLGLFSMEERARLIGARFEICSEQQTGTRIDVWVPQPYLVRTESRDVGARPIVQGNINELWEVG
jgi:signal transduction histidine kinase